MAKRQYYKVINPDGHNGYVYHMGLNTDPHPRPLDQVGSCESGALYFTDAKHLSDFRWCGSKIAWVTPRSKIKADSGNKWKAHQIEITKMLPIASALPLIYDNLQDLANAYEYFRIKIPDKVRDAYLASMTPIQRYKWINTNGNMTLMKKFLTPLPYDAEVYKAIASSVTAGERWLSCEMEYIIKHGFDITKMRRTYDLMEFLGTRQGKAHLKTLKKERLLVLVSKLVK